MTGKRRTVLVTGASGFLGQPLCERLKKEGAEVRALGRALTEGPWDTFIQCDLAKEAPSPDSLKDVSIIFHLASRAHALSDREAEDERYHSVIVEGTRRLLKAAESAGVEVFVYLSSVKAMGEGNPEDLPLVPMDESWPHTPQTPYGLAKAEAEGLVRNSSLPHICVLRPVMIYGPGEKGNLPRLIEAVRKERFPPLPEIRNRRSMIHVDDVVEYAMRAALRPIAAGKTYILTGPDAPSTRQLYDAIRESLAMSTRRWSIPMSLLQGAAWTGSLLGRILGRRMPLDRDTLGKLIGSAWYSGKLAERELGHEPAFHIKEWLLLRQSSEKDT